MLNSQLEKILDDGVRAVGLEFAHALAFVYLFTLSQGVLAGGESRSPLSSKYVAQSPLDVPVHVKPCAIQEVIEVNARVKSKVFFDSRAEYYSTIKSIDVVLGQSVKKGQILATTDTESIEKMRDIYFDYSNLTKEYMGLVDRKVRTARARKERLSKLVVKGIVPVAEVDQLEKMISGLDSELTRARSQLEDFEKNVGLYTSQIRKSNFYSEIDGVVTRLIADPRSMTGVLMVQPGSLVVKVEQPGAYVAEAQLLDTQVSAVKDQIDVDVILPDGSRSNGKVSYVSPVPASLKDQNGYPAPSAKDPSQSKSAMTYYKAAVEFPRSGTILPESLLGIVRIAGKEIKYKRCLPWNAIEYLNGEAAVRSFKDGIGWDLAPIKIGRIGRYDVEVLSDLPEDTVVMSHLW